MKRGSKQYIVIFNKYILWLHPYASGWTENICAYTDLAGYFSYFKRVSPNTNIKFLMIKSKTFFEKYPIRFCLKTYKNEKVGMIKTINEIIKIQ